MSKKLLHIQMLPSQKRSFEETLNQAHCWYVQDHAKSFSEVISCIVGKGSHSEGGIAKVRLAIEELMRKYVSVHSAKNSCLTHLIRTDTS